ncbi:oxygen-dependent coproporphyrinogen oxidase [Bernardetia sp. Wsw4-3y2]|uniref:oxygen-dependent coproporphyrinogen oxidase n=1 Tax=Bernardetia sp. Wsw4-3y2 TaxID=3127471 RepID=UPI0030D2B3CB
MNSLDTTTQLSNDFTQHKTQISTWFQGLQSRICQALEEADGKSSFQIDTWERKGGGGGKSRVIENGNLIEKGGVNFSAVFGESPDQMLKLMKLEPADFFATGVSIVLHPKNPLVPIIHMNVRYFEMSNGIYWFGGGIDLTPHYVFDEDAKFFHHSLKTACDKHHKSYYPEFKKKADDYFYIPHRKETRGIGGIFFDHLKEQEDITKQDRWDFVREIGEAFAPIYTQIANKNKTLPFTKEQTEWQRIRRGRYVEFNLVYDRGTKFGLETDGRTESILMSLPPKANWQYAHEPQKGSEEERTLELLKKGIDWV